MNGWRLAAQLLAASAAVVVVVAAAVATLWYLGSWVLTTYFG